jgi:hypothetical protein
MPRWGPAVVHAEFLLHLVMVHEYSWKMKGVSYQQECIVKERGGRRGAVAATFVLGAELG